MNAQTRSQLLEINRRFYEAHAEAFDRSRAGRPWPGWQRLLAALPSLAVHPASLAAPPTSPTPPAGAPPSALSPDAAPAPAAAPARPSTPRRRLGRVLDIGCGNARFACFLDEAGLAFSYTGVDANAALLEAARRRLPPDLRPACRLIRQDFLAGASPGAALPAGPFELVVLMGVLHHVPGADWRLALLRAAAARLAPGGCLALAVWQFASEPRELRKRVAFEALGPVLGRPIDVAALEPGDALLRFGADPATPPRYCHAVSEAERTSWPGALGLVERAGFAADGPRGESNRYALLQRS